MHDKLLIFGDKTSILKSTDFNLFSRCDSLKNRAAIGFALGLDDYQGGYKGIGPSKLNDKIVKIEKDHNVDLD